MEKSDMGTILGSLFDNVNAESPINSWPSPNQIRKRTGLTKFAQQNCLLTVIQIVVQKMPEALPEKLG
jgi:hypothetical protein